MDGMGFLSGKYGGNGIGSAVPAHGWDAGSAAAGMDTSPTGAWNQPGAGMNRGIPMNPMLPPAPGPAPSPMQPPPMGGIPIGPTAPRPAPPIFGGTPMPMPPQPAPQAPPAPRGPNARLPINQPRVPPSRRPFQPIVLE